MDCIEYEDILQESCKNLVSKEFLMEEWITLELQTRVYEILKDGFLNIFTKPEDLTDKDNLIVWKCRSFDISHQFIGKMTPLDDYADFYGPTTYIMDILCQALYKILSRWKEYEKVKLE